MIGLPGRDFSSILIANRFRYATKKQIVGIDGRLFWQQCVRHHFRFKHGGEQAAWRGCGA